MTELSQWTTPFKVLVVDDIAMNRQLVAALLEPFDVQVKEAVDGLEAIDAANHEAFDLILMDLQMPRMDGLAATRAIRERSTHNASTAILAFTAGGRQQFFEACMQAGMNDFVGKPINTPDLLSKIGHWARAGHLSPSACVSGAPMARSARQY